MSEQNKGMGKKNKDINKQKESMDGQNKSFAFTDKQNNSYVLKKFFAFTA